MGYGRVEKGDPDCALPASEGTGAFHLKLKGEVAKKLGVRAAMNNNYNLTVITTGDDDEGDCSHNGVRVEGNVGYVVLPEQAL